MQNRTPQILNVIDFEKLIINLMETEKTKNSSKEYPHAPISYAAYQFAKDIINTQYLKALRSDNFCVDLTKTKIENWTKEQCRAFAKLFGQFSNEAAIQLSSKQENKIDVRNFAQLLFVKLPTHNNENRKKINEINKVLMNKKYEISTGNEDGITLLRFINSKRKNPIPLTCKINYSITLVVVTDNDQVLLLKRGGLSGRAGSWGTLTGRPEKDELKNTTLIREVHEEINVALENKIFHYVGSCQTKDFNKDLVAKGAAVSFADDCSHVYGVIIPEDELKNTIKLDDENTDWKLFSRNELTQFKVHSVEVHGENYDTEELHVAAAKALLVLDAAKNNFRNIEEKRFTFPYTDSHGFFAHFKNDVINKDDQRNHIQYNKK